MLHCRFICATFASAFETLMRSSLQNFWRGARVVMEQIANLSTRKCCRGSNPRLSAFLFSGCSVARLSRRVWDAEVAGSNPATPTKLSRSFSEDNERFFSSSRRGSAVKSSVYSIFGLVPKYTYEDMHKFKKARLVKSKAAKGNYIMFYVWDAQKNDLVRQRKYIPKKYRTEAEQKAYAKDVIKQINKLLADGFHIDRKKVSKNTIDRQNPVSEKIYSVREATTAFIEIKKAKKLYKRGIEFYTNTLERFVKWLADKGLDSVWIGDLDNGLIQEYFIHLLTNRKNSAKTYKNTLGVLKTFYNVCLKQEWVEGKNPFDKVDKLPEEYGTKSKKPPLKTEALIFRLDPKGHNVYS